MSENTNENIKNSLKNNSTYNIINREKLQTYTNVKKINAIENEIGFVNKTLGKDCESSYQIEENLSFKRGSSKQSNENQCTVHVSLEESNESSLDSNFSNQQGRSKQFNEKQEEGNESSSDSNYSDFSGFSDVSGKEWKPKNAHPFNWVQKQIYSGANPRELLSQFLPSSAHQISPGLNDMTLWRILAGMLSEPPRRQKLRYVNSFDDVVQLIEKSKNIIVLTGAGVSVSCGIPDFRSSDGIYSRLAMDYPDLPDPQAMFDINYFSRDPRPFFKFAREIYPGQFKPSPCHRFIKLLERKNKLLRNYTQNIDTLEQIAGIDNVIECHGSFSTASCTKCKFKCNADAIRDDIFSQRIPVCQLCQPNVHQSIDASQTVSETDLRELVENGIMKPDIVFFGESLPDKFHSVMASDKDKCDMLIVIGSSLKVRPVALIPSALPSLVPQILINREQLQHLEFDVELLGDSDIIINQICHRLGEDWREICFDQNVLVESKELQTVETEDNDTDVADILDIDTQSIKSNESNDVVHASAGTCSDSGFESSTSSFVGPTKTNDKCSIKSTEFIYTENHNLTRTIDSIDDSNSQIENSDSKAVSKSYCNFSIGSSEENNILFNSNLPGIAPSCSSILSKATKFGTDDKNEVSTPKVIANTVSRNFIVKSNDTENKVEVIGNKSKSNLVLGAHGKLCNRTSIVDRLLQGTYFCHESSFSYVFPGAQVTWYSDSDDDYINEDVQNEYSAHEDNENDFSRDSNTLSLSASTELEKDTVPPGGKDNSPHCSKIVEDYEEYKPPPTKKFRNICSEIESTTSVPKSTDNESVMLSEISLNTTKSSENINFCIQTQRAQNEKDS